jgi:hypothetical protein
MLLYRPDDLQLACSPHRARLSASSVALRINVLPHQQQKKHDALIRLVCPTSHSQVSHHQSPLVNRVLAQPRFKMMDPIDANQQPDPADAVELEQQPPPFAPIYTLVNNTSTRTTHHPRVHYIFSDDDPDLLTQALAQQHDANMHESSSNPAINNRAVILDVGTDAEGGYNVSWASSLSPSWAVLDASLSRISPPSSDTESGNGANDSPKKSERLMLRIEGVESGAMASERELRLSEERSGGSGSGNSGASGHRDAEDYTSLVDEFEKKMSLLRKLVDAGEDRRRKIAVDPAAAEASGTPDEIPDSAATMS